jgi:hypothetical protein
MTTYPSSAASGVQNPSGQPQHTENIQQDLERLLPLIAVLAGASSGQQQGGGQPQVSPQGWKFTFDPVPTINALGGIVQHLGPLAAAALASASPTGQTAPQQQAGGQQQTDGRQQTDPQNFWAGVLQSLQGNPGYFPGAVY